MIGVKWLKLYLWSAEVWQWPSCLPTANTELLEWCKLLRLNQQSGHMCWRSESIILQIYFYIFIEMSFCSSMYSRFQLNIDSVTPDCLYIACMCKQRDGGRIYTGAGLIFVFVKLPHVAIPWQWMWCCIPEHDFKRSGVCMRKGCPHTMTFLLVSSQNNNAEVFKKMLNQLLYKVVWRLNCWDWHPQNHSWRECVGVKL